MSLYRLITKAIDGMRVAEATGAGHRKIKGGLPDVQQAVLSNWGKATEENYGERSTWGASEGKYVKFWLLNDGLMVHVPYAHATFGAKMDRVVGRSKFDDDKRREMLSSGAVAISVANDDINIEEEKGLNSKQKDVVADLFDRYGFKKIYYENDNDTSKDLEGFDSKDKLRWMLDASARELELVTANESVALPPVQQKIKDKWGTTKEADYVFSEYPGEEDIAKFWLYNNGELLNAPFAHMAFGEWLEGDASADEEYDRYSDENLETLKEMEKSGAAMLSYHQSGRLTISHFKKLTTEQVDAIVKLANHYSIGEIDDSAPQDYRSFGVKSDDDIKWKLTASKREMELATANEATTMSAISYLPTQLGSVKAMLTNLAKEKPDWDIEVLEDLDPKQFIIKDRATFSVPKEHWDGFLKIFGNGINGKMLKLGSAKESVNEASEADMRKLRDQLKKTLDALVSNKEFMRVSEMASRWVNSFGIAKYTTTDAKSVAIADEVGSDSIQIIYDSLIKEYGDDRGNIELLIDALKEKTELNSFAIFRNFDYLFGTRINSSYEGFDMSFESYIDFMYDMTQSIYVENQDLLDKIEEDIVQGIKVANKVIWPIGGQFSPSIFERIRAVIDDMVTEKEEPEKEE